MRVLQLCNKPSYPANDGGCIAMKNISLGLINNNIDLKVICISTVKHPFKKDNFPTDFLEKTKIESVFLDTKLNIVDAFSSIITSDCYNVNRFFSADFDIKLTEILKNKEFDLILLESLFLTPYIGTIQNNSKSKIILRSHNFEYLIWERLADKEKNPLKKGYLKHLSSNLKKFESKIIRDVDGVATISKHDTTKYKAIQPNLKITTIPFGIDFDNYKPSYNSLHKTIKLFHIGSMDWNPNIEAVDWFLNSIFDEIKGGDIELHLAGKSMPDSLLKLKKDHLFVHGQVDSAIDFISKYDIMIVPLLSGGGMRIKIIEAMAMGKTVITTTIGLEGINATHNENILIADTKEEFISQINRLNSQPELLNSIGKKARVFIEKEHDNDRLIKSLISFYETL